MTDHRPEWDQTWLEVAEVMSRRSRCSRAQIGAVIVSANGRISATGYNGPAATLSADGPCVEWCARARGESSLDMEYASCPSIHAELNALMYVDRSRVEGGAIYVNSSLCMNCAKAISNSGLRRVTYLSPSEDDSHRAPSDVVEYLRSCGLEVTEVPRV